MKQKYKVRLLNNDITKEDKRVFVTAISCKTAKRIAETFNKGYKAEVAIRQGNADSFEKQLEDIGIAYQIALSEGNDEVAQELKDEYNTLVTSIRQGMDACSWGIVKKEIVELV